VEMHAHALSHTKRQVDKDMALTNCRIRVSECGNHAAPEGRLATVAVETVSSVTRYEYSLKNRRQWPRGVTLVSGVHV
jgi:hypothetical protein